VHHHVPGSRRVEQAQVHRARVAVDVDADEVDAPGGTSRLIRRRREAVGGPGRDGLVRAEVRIVGAHARRRGEEVPEPVVDAAREDRSPQAVHVEVPRNGRPEGRAPARYGYDQRGYDQRGYSYGYDGYNRDRRYDDRRYDGRYGYGSGYDAYGYDQNGCRTVETRDRDRYGREVTRYEQVCRQGY